MPKAKLKQPLTTKDVLNRYPCLVSHMICESLGYFTPEAAARAARDYIENQPCYCEWYCYMSDRSGKSLLNVGKRVLSDSFRNRHFHKGYMADYDQARALVDHVRKGGEGPLFASWF